MKFRFIFMGLSLLAFAPLGANAALFDPHFIITDELLEERSMSFSELDQFLKGRGGILGRLIDIDVDGVIKLASEIIHRAAQEHRISPKALLVTLQKEQSLVDDPNPSARQIEWAAGYGVCDNCSTADPKLQKLKGFSKQIDAAAWQLRRYLDEPEKFSIQPATPTTIDGEKVVPVNRATAALYNYTPHFHGNKNFSTIWERFFGPQLPGGTVTTPALRTDATYISQTTGIVRIQEGESARVTFRYKNTGTSIWQQSGDGRIVLANARVKEVLPAVNGADVRVAQSEETHVFPLAEERVLPGEIGTFEVPFVEYAESETVGFVVVWEGRGWFSNTQASVIVQVQPKGYGARAQMDAPSSLEPGAEASVKITLENTGKWEWTHETFTIRMPEQFRHARWKQPSGDFKISDTYVAPGSASAVTIPITAPERLGEYAFSVGAFLSSDAQEYARKEGGEQAVRFAGFPVATNIAIDTSLKGDIMVNTIPPAVKTSWKPVAVLRIKNAGDRAWKGIEIRSTDLSGKKSPFYHPSWDSWVSVSKTDASVEPGGVVTLSLPLAAPLKAGIYRWAFSLKTGDRFIYLNNERVHEQVTRVDP